MPEKPPKIEQVGEWLFVPPELSGRFTPISKPEPLTRPSRPERGGRVPIEKCAEILGKENVFGPKDVEKTWGVRVEAPPIPFSKEDLERAKELGQMLVLRIDKTTDGKPLTVQTMATMLADRYTQGGQGVPVYEQEKADNWRWKEPIYTSEIPRTGWALVSKELIPNSISKKYIDQIETVIQYLKDQVFKDQQIPLAYQEAIQEFESQKAGLIALVSSDWKEAARRLATLKITQCTQNGVAEEHYDLFSHFDATGKRLLPSSYARTSSRAADGILVLVGYFDAKGVCGLRWRPDYAAGHVGVSFSRLA